MVKMGKYVNSSRQTTIARKEGSIDFEILSILSPEMAEATKRFIP